MGRKMSLVGFTASSMVSLTGNSIAAVVLPLIQLAATGDALAAGIIALACAVPQVLAGVFGGALLDRFNRRDISIVSDVVSALSIAALAVVDMTLGLSLEWFIVLGIEGAIGDIPGMTARDTLLPSAVDYDGRDLQQFMGVYGAIQSLAVIVGPALAALSMSALGTAGALWFTAGMSFAAAGISLFIPKEVGWPSIDEDADHLRASKGAQTTTAMRAVLSSMVEGIRILFKLSPILRFSTAATLAVVMVIGAVQGIVLPAFFTEQGTGDLLGYVLSALSAGTLVGSLAYAVLANRLGKRAWYAFSIVGMAIGMAVMCSLNSYAAIVIGSAALGFFSGPISALLGYLAYEIIPDEQRGATLGAQNSLLLAASPLAVFVAAALISACGVRVAAALLCAVWFALSVFALVAKSMRDLDRAFGSE
ncbi:MAG: MFS transporter [Eggerthellaceae bacterium]|nr:MFS transporter [Eggerthellaceae bacterium]